jgi:hypothetical protein
MKRLRWEPARADRPVPKHPYRDSALVYAGLALVVVLLTFVTGGSVVRAIVVALFVYVAATLWSWRIWRNRLREQAAAERDRAAP